MLHAPRPEAFAIIGIGCRFPGGANSPAQFWKLLCDGVDAITEIPRHRFDIDAYFDPDPGKPGKMSVRWGGYVEDIETFDAQFFGVSPREATRIDPQHRLLLESAWEALEDGGQDPHALADTPTGVFVGLSSHDYGNILSDPSHRELIDAHLGVGNAMSIAANRISHFFAFRGPSFVVDTACSSSLTAVHLACRSLANRACSLAIAGGASVLLTPESTLAIAKAGMLSPDGRCKAFDARANGYVRSEGAGVIVLKPLAEALENRDPIYAVIRGSAVNHDGHTVAMAVPGRDAQEGLIREVLQRAGISPSAVQYMEAHGTGTPVGDPIEAAAIGTALGIDRDASSPCLIGSVKTNIGHLEAASGIAGLIKTALALKHRQIPPSLHFREPNPAISFDDLRLRVATTLLPWPRGDRAVAGVNSFGFGGANAHVILEEPPAVDAELHRDRHSPHILTISGRSEAALREMVQRYRRLCSDGPSISLSDICYTASVRRTHHEHRAGAVADSREELIDHLDAFLAGESRAAVASGRSVRNSAPRLAFVFAGMGPQWWGMGRQLMKQERLFRDVLEECDDLLRPLSKWSLIDQLMKDEAHSRVGQADLAQVANFAIQAALTAVWGSWGITPDAVVGHSAGEKAAAYASGAIGLSDALRVAFHRGRLQYRTTGTGKMLAVGLSFEAVGEAIAGYEQRISVAAVNSPTSVTLSGDSEALQELVSTFERQQVFCRVLPVDVPYHGPQMERIRDELLDVLDGIETRVPVIPIVSSTLGTWSNGQPFNAEYWWQNIRKPVRFAAAIDQLIQDGYELFVEVGPHPVLAGSISECAAHRRKNVAVVPTLRRMEDERLAMLRSLATLYARGRRVNWSGVYPTGNYIALPQYAWQRERYWFEPPSDAATGPHRVAGQDSGHPLLGWRLRSVHPTWESELCDSRLDYLAGHAVQGDTVFPAAAYVEMAFAAARELGIDDETSVDRMSFRRVLVLDKRDPATVQFLYEPDDRSFEIHSAAKGTQPAWTLNASGRLGVQQPGAMAAADLGAIKRRCPTAVSVTAAYDALAERGLQYSGAFRAMVELWQGDSEALGRIALPDSLIAEDKYQLHPALLDAAFHVLIAATDPIGVGDAQVKGAYVVASIERIELHGCLGRQCWSHATVRRPDSSVVEGNIELIDDDGNVTASVTGLRCRLVEQSLPARREGIDDWLYQVRWEREPVQLPAAQQLTAIRSPLQLFEKISQARERFADEWRRANYDLNFETQVNTITSQFILSALTKLGWTNDRDAVRPADAIATSLGVASQHRRFFSRLLEIARADTVSLSADANVCRRLCDVVRLRYPENSVGLDMLVRCGDHLAEILRGDVDVRELLFSSDGLSAWEHFFDQPWYKFYNQVAAETVALAIEDLARSRAVRILEVGGGTGATTALVLSRLPLGTHYVFTDITPFFLAQARQRFRDHPLVEFALLDIETNPVAQHFEPHSFDLVLAANVFHATENLRDTARNVQRLLTPGGLLVILEGTHRLPYLDLIFGVTEGWWRFTDHDIRPSHPLLRSDEWRELFEDVGFKDPRGLRLNVESVEPVQTVLVGQMPQETVVEPDRRTTPEKTWLIFADHRGVGQQMATSLTSGGDECVLVFAGSQYRQLEPHVFEVASASSDQIGGILEQIDRGALTVTSLLHLWSLDAPSPDRMTTSELMDFQRVSCDSVVTILQAFEKRGQTIPDLWLITAGAQALDDTGEALNISQAPLWGLGRVVINEQPTVRTRLVDLSAACTPEEIACVVRELNGTEFEEEVAFRTNQRFVRRLHRISLEGLGTSREQRDLSPATASFRLEIGSPGSLETLTLREMPAVKLEPDEVAVRVLSGGLNFRDVMLALGMLPSAAFRGGADRLLLGTECSGVVVECGDRVTTVRPGDEVMALGTGTFGSRIRTVSPLVVRKPSHLTFEEAATIPAGFLTAHYALNHLAKLSTGERVLIHAATGGVGLAAIQLASRAGAEIFATAGNPEKRSYLQSLGITHIFDSRSLAFADEILELTNGEGVDVILNSLMGDAIAKGLSILRPYGRFVEIGKRDIYQNSSIGMLAFNRNLAFFSVALDQLCAERAALAGEMLQAIVEHVSDRLLHPLPHTDFDFSESEEAFRALAKAKHIGKVVLSFREPHYRVALRGGQSTLRPDATYLITGGLGGFGLTVAHWMVQQGARNIVLMSRSGTPLEENAAALDALLRSDAHVVIASGNVSREEDVARVFAEIRGTNFPLKGVIHAAVVVDDAPLVHLDPGRMRRVLAPKVAGAWNLHAQTLDEDLDFFVLFSSATSVFGSPGQGNYSAANAFLDSLAPYRRSLGLQASTINWGWLSGTGYVARHADLVERLARQRLQPFTPDEAVETLDRLLRCRFSQVIAMRQDWDAWSEVDQVLAGVKKSKLLSYFDEMKHTPDARDADARDPVLHQLVKAPPEGRQAILEEYIVGKVAKVLGSSPHKIDRQRPLTEMGLDSLMAVELQVMLSLDLRIQIAIVKLIQGLSLTNLAESILEQLSLGKDATAAADPQIAQERPPVTPQNDAKADDIEPLDGHDDYYASLDYSRWSPRQKLAQRILAACLYLSAKVEVEGLEHIPSSGPLILAANHLSLMDAPLLAILLPRRTILVAGERWEKVPLVHRALDFVDTIFIRRGEGDREALNRGLAVLRAGGVLGLAPEGRISRSGGLSAGHTGIAYLALEAHAPVLPFVVYGQEQISANVKRLRRTRVHVRIGPPIDLPRGERTAAKLRRDTECVMNTLANMLPPAYRGVYSVQ